MDFNKIFKYAWEIFVKDIIPLIVGGLIAGILGAITLGILVGPLYGGIVKMIIRRIRENKPPEIGDIFSAMDQFGVLFLTTLVLGILIFLGFLLCIVPGVLLATIWMYVIIFIVDKPLSMGEAMSKSKELVSKVGFGMHLVMLLILGAIVGLLSVTYIGGLVASSFIMVVVCVMYFLFTGEENLLIMATSRASNINQQQPFDTIQKNKTPAVSQDLPVVTNSPSPSTPVESSAPSQPAAQSNRIAHLICSNCSARAEGGSFCTMCGSPLKIVCSNCRKALVSGARFCPSCGFKIEQ